MLKSPLASTNSNKSYLETLAGYYLNLGEAYHIWDMNDLLCT